MSLIENERTKLLANALDRASTACVTVGVLAPIAAFIYGLSGTRPDVSALIFGGSIWILSAVALHWMARLALRGLKS